MSDEQVFRNPLDNSQNVPIETKKSNFLASNTGMLEELQEKNIYLKNLQLQIQMTKDLYEGTTGWKAGTIAMTDEATGETTFVHAAKLMLKQDRFQSLQQKIIVYLNTVGPEDELYRSLASDLGTSDIWTLSSELANHILQRDKAESLYNLFRGTPEDKTDPYYKLLVDATPDDRAKYVKQVKGRTFKAPERSF
jgi:hypothetical protein